MTKQVLNQLVSLVKVFNNGHYDDTHRYVMDEPMMYKRGRYSMIIHYEIFFSLDMLELMRFAVENNLLVRMAYNKRTGKPYMDIQ